jgi:hypothetical protein
VTVEPAAAAAVQDMHYVDQSRSDVKFGAAATASTATAAASSSGGGGGGGGRRQENGPGTRMGCTEEVRVMSRGRGKQREESADCVSANVYLCVCLCMFVCVFVCARVCIYK